MRDNQTTRRMPMIVTAMACATASMLAGLALAPSAMAAGATITLQGADGASLAGHTFNVYQIGTYTDQVLDGAQISSLGVRGTTASNAWAADAISIANAYDPDTGDNIAKVYGYDDAGNIANIKMDSQTRQLRNISKALSQSLKKPAAIQGGANLTTTRSTLTINVPAEGFYYITDSAGNPIMIGTKSGNANIMKNDAKDPQWRTLGTAVVKAKSVRVDKKVQVQRNGTTVGKDGTTNDPVGVTVGDTVTNTVEVTVPNKQAAGAVKFKLVDQPKGQTYVKGSLSVRLKNAPQTDITADAIVYDGTTQNNAKSIPGDAFSTVTIPGDAKEPKITRPGYRFVGWSTEKNPPAGSTFLQPGEGKVTLPAEGSTTVYAQWEPSLTTLPFTGGQAQVPTIWLYAGFALMLIALGVMMPMLRMRMAATKRTGKHMPITGGKHAK